MLKRKKINISDNITLSLFNTDKYKDLNIYFSFAMPGDIKTKAILHILRNMMISGCQDYPDKRSFSRIRSLLYGASAVPSVSVIDYQFAYNIHFNFVSLEYIKDISLNDYISFIKSIIFKPLLNEELFKESIKITKDKIQRRYDNPESYATKRAINIISEELINFNLHTLDFYDYLDEITLEDVKNVYDYLINKSSKSIYVIGKIDKELIKAIKDLPLKASKFKKVKSVINELVDKKEIVEEKKISQSSLRVLYKLKDDNIYQGKNLYSLFLLSSLLGNLPCSLLFSEVREKLSLCYSIGINSFRKEGIFMVFTEISSKNKDEVINQIEKQIQRIINKDYSDELLDTCKKLFINSYISSLDNADSIINFYNTNDYCLIEESFESLFKGINKVTKDDLKELLTGYSHILTYVLKENEKASR